LRPSPRAQRALESTPLTRPKFAVIVARRFRYTASALRADERRERVNAIEQAQQLIDRLNSTQPNRTQIRAIATEYGKNQETADELWTHGGTSARLLALLMLDLKAITTHSTAIMITDIEAADPAAQWKSDGKPGSDPWRYLSHQQITTNRCRQRASTT
jgi:hypothetical protein